MIDWEVLRRRWHEVREQRSQARKVTRRNQVLLEAGVHPATRRPLSGLDETCGSCGNLTSHGRNRRTYYKCGLTDWTYGLATDVRLSWPACVMWEPDA